MKNLLKKFSELIKIIKTLRAPGGCPWDIAQTPHTMREPLLDETYEVLDALDELKKAEKKKPKKKASAHVREELGDVLFNILMVSYMFEQEGAFSVADVISDVGEKIVRRHPHVFGKTAGFAGKDDEAKVKTPDAVLKQWDEIKQKVEKRTGKSILDGIPKSYPAVLRSFKMQKKMSKVGFEFRTVADVRAKVDEELGELDAEIENASIKDAALHDERLKTLDHAAKTKIENELGDVLFAAVNLARALKINPELALNASNEKFSRRVQYIEKAMQKKGLPLSSEYAVLMNELWEEAKSEE